MPEANVGRKRHGEDGSSKRRQKQEWDRKRMKENEREREKERETESDRERAVERAHEGKDERTERAEASARSFPFWGRRGGRKGGGGANSRDINSVLALGGLQRRKLRAEGEYYPLPFPPACSSRPMSIPPLPPCLATTANATTLARAKGGRGVTNQRLAIVNSTCAVKQLINKRLFTSCARGGPTRAYSPAAG